MIGLRCFPLKSADARGAGTRDEPLRTSAWEAMGYAPGMALTWRSELHGNLPSQNG